MLRFVDEGATLIQSLVPFQNAVGEGVFASCPLRTCTVTEFEKALDTGHVTELASRWSRSAAGSASTLASNLLYV